MGLFDFLADKFSVQDNFKEQINQKRYRFKKLDIKALTKDNVDGDLNAQHGTPELIQEFVEEFLSPMLFKYDKWQENRYRKNNGLKPLDEEEYLEQVRYEYGLLLPSEVAVRRRKRREEEEQRRLWEIQHKLYEQEREAYIRRLNKSRSLSGGGLYDDTVPYANDASDILDKGMFG